MNYLMNLTLCAEILGPLGIYVVYKKSFSLRVEWHPISVPGFVCVCPGVWYGMVYLVHGILYIAGTSVWYGYER